MKKSYLVIMLVIILATTLFFIAIRMSKFFQAEKSHNEKVSELTEPTVKNLNAPKEFISANRQFNDVFTRDVEGIVENYSDDVEVNWQGGSLAGVYKGKDNVQGFWHKLFENTLFVSSDFHDFITENNSVSAILAFTRFSDGKPEVIERRYEAQFNDNGKIVREIWSMDQ